MSGNDEHLRRAYPGPHDLEVARREQREASQRGRKSQEIGREFHYDMAELRGETPKNGWQHERATTLDGQTRKHDAAGRTERGRSRGIEHGGGSRRGGSAPRVPAIKHSRNWSRTLSTIQWLGRSLGRWGVASGFAAECVRSPPASSHPARNHRRTSASSTHSPNSLSLVAEWRQRTR